MRLLFIFLCFLPLSTFAQKTVVDTVRYRFSYAAKLSYAEEKRKLFEDEVCVDIGDKITYCYGYWDVENGRAIDSIRSHGGQLADYFALGNPIAVYQYYTLKNYPTEGQLTFTYYTGQNFIYTEPLVQKEWQLVEGDTTILGYSCKKAVGTFRHRTWNVWYAPDIPISEGPWKLDGLPGMILRAVDTKEQFYFDCIGVKQNVNQPMSVNLSKKVKTNPVQLERIMKLELKDYNAYKKAVGGLKGVHWDYTPKSRTACLLEYYEPDKK